MKNFITIEGCEGVGKSTQLQLLKKYCSSTNQNVVFTREPGGSKIAESIRKIVLDKDNTEMSDLCEAFLYAASRIQHLSDIVIPSLKDGKVVICDRFVDSSYAYQGVARGLGLELVTNLNALAVGDYMPEYTIFLDLDPVSAFARKGGADASDRLEQQAISFYHDVYSGYKQVIANDPARFIIIDASGDADDVFSKVVGELIERGILV